MTAAMETSVELSLQIVLDALKCVVTPCKTQDQKETLEEVFLASAQNAARVLGVDIPRNSQCHCTGAADSPGRWDHVEVTLFILRSLKTHLADEELSVSQLKDVRSCFQFVVTLGLCPYLLPGVGIPLSSRISSSQSQPIKEISILLKYERLCFVVKSLLDCCEHKLLRSLIISHIFEDLMAALMQLSFAPLKKPHESIEISGDCSQFVMSFDLWQNFSKDQIFFKEQLMKLISGTYQPTVVSKLMLLQGREGVHNPPIWMKKKCSMLLTQCLVKPGGVASLIRATFDSTPDVGKDWEKIEVLARLITSPSNYLENVANQLFMLILESGQSLSSIFVVVMACVKELMIKDSERCQKLIVDPLLLPFLSCSSYIKYETNYSVILSEEKVLLSINCLLNCFLPSGSDLSSYCLPIDLLVPCTSFLFNLYCKVNGSASYLSSKTEKLLFQIFRGCDSEVLVQLLRCLLFQEESAMIPLFPSNLCFNFGSNGGVLVEQASQQGKDILHSSVEDAGDNLIVLLEHQDANDKVCVSIFVSLLQLLIDVGLNTNIGEPHESRIDTVEDRLNSLIYSSQRQLGVVRILAVLVERDKIQSELAKNPTPILTFLLSLLESASVLVTDSLGSCGMDDSGLHCVFVSLMILNVMIEKCQEQTNCLPFQLLLPPLAVIRDEAKDAELSRLASNVHNTIAAHGGNYEKRVPSKGLSKKKTRCQSALHDSCDPLLPVRGHALVELTKLLWSRDHETISLKETVFCVLQENLKNEDSFIYLAAINGMVALATIEPDRSVKSLIDEYVECTTLGNNGGKNPELRMKVGEVLVKLTATLGEMAPKYKNDLLNAFLIGVKDTDNLMRASSLSNLGEVCRILGYRIGSILQEIFVCIESVVKFDKAVEPRRASVMVVSHLIRGLGNNTVHVLQDILLDLYHTLKYVYCNDHDDVVRLHVQLALVELNTATEEFLFPKLKMEKKVTLM